MRASRTPFAAVPEWVFAHPVVQGNRTVLHVYVAMFLDADYGKLEGDADWRAIAERTGLTRPTIYRDIKAMRDAGLIVQIGHEHYFLPADDPSTPIDGSSTPIDGSSTTVDSTSLTELSETEAQREEKLRGFDHFWSAYPKRDGKRLGRGKCEERWAKLSLADRRAAYRGAKHYGAACNGGLNRAKDPERWLRDRLWEDWQEPAVPDAPLGAATRAGLADSYPYRDSLGRTWQDEREYVKDDLTVWEVAGDGTHVQVG